MILSTKQAMDAVKPQSVLVTGGRGFIGRALCNLLQRQGYRVFCLDRPADPPARFLVGAGECQIACDISQAQQLRRVFEADRIDGIVHLAAILPTAAQREPLRAIEVNVTGSLNLLEMAREFRVRRFVFASSLSVYGTYPDEEVVTETHRAAPEDVYGATKLCLERVGDTYRTRFGLDFVSLRIGRVIGPGSGSVSSAWRSQVFEALQSAAAAEISLPYRESERLLLAHVDDVAGMLLQLLAAERPSHRLYNAACESMTASELKWAVESLNPRVRVCLGNEEAAGNPRRLASQRFTEEFGFLTRSISDHLKAAAGRQVPRK